MIDIHTLTRRTMKYIVDNELEIQMVIDARTCIYYKPYINQIVFVLDL